MNETSTAVPHVYTAIAHVLKALAAEGISKDRKNAQQGFAFRGIDDVYNALTGHLAAAGLLILPRMTHREMIERETKNGGALHYVTVTAEFDLVSAIDGSKHTVRTFGEAMDAADKATNKAMSAAFKYAAFQSFCIPTEGDNDADSTTHEVAPVRRATSERPAANGTQSKRETAPAPLQAVDWRQYVIHFGKQRGQTLGSLNAASLNWWIEEWQPKPYQGKIDATAQGLRNALDRARAELREGFEKQEAEHSAGQQSSNGTTRQPDGEDDAIPDTRSAGVNRPIGRNLPPDDDVPF